MVSSNSTSSIKLHQDFWDWRRAYPKGLYWVHFQTTDVHPPYNPVDPFAGLFVSPEEKKQLRGWQRLINQQVVSDATSISDAENKKLKKSGLETAPYFNTLRGLYEETMAHQDFQLNQLVNRLKSEGEWENTLLIIASDHGHPASIYSRFGRALEDPMPEEWRGGNTWFL
jgi:arylsulfatase A-like enzyme